MHHCSSMNEGFEVSGIAGGAFFFIFPKREKKFMKEKVKCLEGKFVMIKRT